MRLDEIHVFPVKAMAGQRVEAWPVDPTGLVGDRAWALVDGDCKLGTGKDSTRFRRHDEVFTWAARLPSPSGRPEVACPDEGMDWSPVDAPGVSALLRQQAERAGAGTPAVPTAWEASPFAADERGLKDSSPVSLVGTATLAALGELLGTPPVDPRHLRANLVVETDTPYVEDSWVGRTVTIGDVRLAGLKQIGRCRMVDLAQVGLDAAPGLLKATGSRGAKAAIYLAPLDSGELRVGADVRVD